MAKSITLVLAFFYSIFLSAAIPQQTCQQHLERADHLVEGVVKNISTQLECWNEACNYYSLQYTAELLVSKTIKGDLEQGQTIYVTYEENYQYVHEDEYPIVGFQGYSPVPQKWQYWAVFLNRKSPLSDAPLQVAPPNGWWQYDDATERCW